MRFYASVVLVTLWLVGCGGSNGDAPRVGNFHNISQASAELRNSAKAVVRIVNENDSTGTGFFISSTGLMVTNDHVLGSRDCAKEGCHLLLNFGYQSGSPYVRTEAFAVPVAFSAELDVAILQVYTNNTKSQRLNTPDYLSLENSRQMNPGDSAYTVGHPAGGLKKFTEGKYVGNDGAWIKISNYSLGGSSGSPVFGADGRLIGILHSSRSQVTHSGEFKTVFISSGSALKAFASSNQSSPMHSVNDVVSESDILDYTGLYLAAHQPMVKTERGASMVLDVVGRKCDAMMARNNRGIEDVNKTLFACDEIHEWLNCRDDRRSYQSCPADKAAWKQRLNNVTRFAIRFHSEDAIGWATGEGRALETDSKARMSGAQTALQNFLSSTNSGLSFKVAKYLLDHEILNYRGTDLKGYVMNYKADANHPHSWRNIIDSFFIMYYDNNQISQGELTNFVNDALRSDKIEVRTQLQLEGRAYRNELIK